jgi:two-component system, response regulator / RNA-binding antiterminator
MHSDALQQFSMTCDPVPANPDASASSDLKILVIDENPIRRAILEAGLREAGFGNITLLNQMTGLLDQIYVIDPDVVVIDLENPSRDVLEQMFQMSRIVKRPIAMFVDHSDRATIDAAIDAGVSAYIVDGLKKERVRPILEMTISRFRAFDALRLELESTKSALRERKLIERAKGLLMKSKGLDEEAAYNLLRRTAMNQNRRIGEVAENLISAYDLLKQ